MISLDIATRRVSLDRDQARRNRQRTAAELVVASRLLAESEYLVSTDQSYRLDGHIAVLADKITQCAAAEDIYNAALLALAAEDNLDERILDDLLADLREGLPEDPVRRAESLYAIDAVENACRSTRWAEV